MIFRPNNVRLRVLMTLFSLCLTMLMASSAHAGVGLSVVASPDPARAGETLDLEFTITNDGASDLQNLVLVFDFPAGLSNMSESLFLDTVDCIGGGNSFICEAGDQALFPIPLLRAGEGIIISVPAAVSSLATNGTIIPLNAEVFNGSLLEASAFTDIVVDSAREIELALVEDHDPAAPNEQMVYTLTYGVIDSSPGSPNALLQLPLPVNTSFVSASHGGVNNGGIVEWSLGNLEPGSIGERSVTVQVSAGASLGSIITAKATYTDTAGNITEYESATRVQNPLPLQIRAVASRDPIRPGELLDLELTVTNKGPFRRTGVKVTMEYPDHMSSLSESFFDADCLGAGNAFTCEPRDRAVFSIGTLEVGEGITLSIPARVLGNTVDGTVITFEAQVNSNQNEQSETGVSIAVDASNGLELAMVEDRDPVAPGDEITYTLSYGVLGDSIGSTNALMSMPIPDGTVFISASDGGMFNGSVVEWPLGNLNAGATGRRELVVQTEVGLLPGDIIFAESHFADENSPVNAASYQCATRVQFAHPLELKIIANRHAARPGEVLDVEVTATNVGAFERNNVQIMIEYPDGLLSLGESFFDGDCIGGGSSFTCESSDRVFFGGFNDFSALPLAETITTLAPGEGVTFSLPLRVSAIDGTAFVLEAQVTDSQGDFRETGTTLTVDSTRELDLAIVESDEPVEIGDQITYTLTYGACNLQGGAPGGILRFTLPNDTTFISANDGGSLNGDEVTWSVGSLNPGSGGIRKVIVQVNGGIPNGTILESAARFDDSSVPANEVHVRETTRVEATAPFDVELNVSPAPVMAGQTLNIELSVTNLSAFVRTNVVMTFEWPIEINSLAESNVGAECVGGGSSFTCDPRDRAFFLVPTLAIGQTITFPFSPVVNAGLIDGTVINFDAWAIDATGFLSSDGDAIMVGNEFDHGLQGDTTYDGIVNVTDLLQLLSAWGDCDDADACPEDSNGDGTVNITDLLTLLSNWG